MLDNIVLQLLVTTKHHHKINKIMYSYLFEYSFVL